MGPSAHRAAAVTFAIAWLSYFSNDVLKLLTVSQPEGDEQVSSIEHFVLLGSFHCI